MLSAGMLAAFASAMIVRSRGFMSGSPPAPRAATVSSLMRRVEILARLASSAPFLCLIEAHLEWPDMSKLPRKQVKQESKCYHGHATQKNAKAAKIAKLTDLCGLSDLCVPPSRR